MFSVSNATQTTATTSTGSATEAKEIDQAQDRFLKLLVTQMQNQDPLNPMDNAQVTSQMAQISTVNGIEKLSASLGSLTSMLQAAKTMQATSMIGRDILVEGSTLNLDKDSGEALGGFELAEKADSVKLEILDSSGKVMQTQIFNNVGAGVTNFAWDGETDAGGEAADGRYSFQVTALRGGEKLDVTSLAHGRVNSVSLSNGDATLKVAGLGEVSLESIKQVM